jgi:hypothetical protein
MSISTNIQEKIDAIHQERVTIPDGQPHPIADEVRTKATNAILGGATNWVKYMQLFAKTPEELARLIPTDGTEEDPEKKEARAYLVANGMCAPGTGDKLLNVVSSKLNL